MSYDRARIGQNRKSKEEDTRKPSGFEETLQQERIDTHGDQMIAELEAPVSKAGKSPISNSYENKDDRLAATTKLSGRDNNEDTKKSVIKDQGYGAAKGLSRDEAHEESFDKTKKAGSREEGFVGTKKFGKESNKQDSFEAPKKSTISQDRDDLPRKVSKARQDRDGSSEVEDKKDTVRQKSSARTGPNRGTDALHSTASASHQERTFWQKCPMWLKILMGLIILIAIGGGLYWFFFKRGKKAKTLNHPAILPHPLKGKAVVTNQTVVTTHPTKPNTLEKTSKVEIHHPEGVDKHVVTATDASKAEVAAVAVIPAQEELPTVGNSKTTVVQKGTRTFCPDDQFLLNGNCMGCPSGQVWSGLNCLAQSPTRHLRRRVGWSI